MLFLHTDLFNHEKHPSLNIPCRKKSYEIYAQKKSFTDFSVLEQEEVDWVRYDQVFVFTPVDTPHAGFQVTLGIFKIK